ncbi:Replication initiation factor [compost metagenome]
MTRFDWYQATVYVPNPQYRGLIDHLSRAWELSDIAPDRGMHGYLHGAKIVRGERRLCTLWWGGNPGVNITSSSEEAPVLAAALRAFGCSYGVTRVDACADWVEEGCFDSLSAHLIAYAQEKGITINQQGDWIRGQARTLYLGSPQSPVRICLYEKGYEQGGDAPKDWTRLEVRVKPKGEHKISVASWEPSDVFAAGWVSEALAVLGWDNLEKRAVGTVWRPDDAERSRLALLRQYGPILSLWASEVGSWESLGSTIGAALGNTAKSSPPQGEQSPTGRAATLQAG